MKRLLMLIALVILTTMASPLKAAVAQDSATSKQFKAPYYLGLKGVVHLNGDTPIKGLKVTVVERGKSYEGYTDIYGEFSLNFPNYMDFTIKLEGYSALDFTCFYMYPRKIGTPYVIINIKKAKHSE